MENNDNQVIQVNNDLESLEAVQRAEYDIQISTAKKYPRNLAKVKERCVAIVALDKDTAASCRYALPRGNKSITGPSVHLARIIAQQYQNLRVNAKISQITDKEIISQAVAHDLETNYAVQIEIRRSITTKQGNRYNDDMITMTGNAANAISFRNAVFAVVPKGIMQACFDASVRVITGDLSNEEKLIAERNRLFNATKKNYDITEEQILAALNLRSINQVKAQQIADLMAICQSIKDGDAKVEEIFIKDPVEEVKDKKADLKNKNGGQQTKIEDLP